MAKGCWCEICIKTLIRIACRKRNTSGLVKLLLLSQHHIHRNYLPPHLQGGQRPAEAAKQQLQTWYRFSVLFKDASHHRGELLYPKTRAAKKPTNVPQSRAIVWIIPPAFQVVSHPCQWACTLQQHRVPGCAASSPGLRWRSTERVQRGFTGRGEESGAEHTEDDG